MPSSLLFAINTEGRIHALSTASSVWREFLYLGLEFKRLSAVPHFLWAIGVDRQVYVHVHGLDIPIRVKEETYENERWLPLEGFSGRMLPTDRHHFSSADGLVNRSIDKIRLPSMAWQWESDWHIETTLDGQPLDHDGWSYAVDFPAQYGPKKQWKSCVRRRKWVRYRRYSALNSWCAVAPLHKDPTQEPFIDVCIGGTALPAAPAGTLLVWAVTSHGRVMFRTGVSTSSPEGLRWTAVPVPSGTEVTQISVGPTGLVWAVLWNGRILVRSGVTKDTPTGESWLEVKPPGEGQKITQVAVGTNSVWCVTMDKRVWFRKGIRGESSGISEEYAMGSGWVEMVGAMSQISVAINDQVWGVGSEDRCLYFRSGVTPSDPTGKKWRCVQAPLQLSRTSSIASLSNSSNRRSVSGSPRDKKHRSWTSLNRGNLNQEQPNSLIMSNLEETSHSAPTHNLIRRNKHSEDTSSEDSKENGAGDVDKTPPNTRPSSLVENNSTEVDVVKKNSLPNDGNAFVITGKHFETTLKNPRAWSPVRSVGSMVGTEAHPDTDCSVFDADISRDSGVFGEEDDNVAALCWAEYDVTWSWVAAGGCTVDSQQLPNWFMDNFSTIPQVELTQEWRLKILDDLKIRPENGEQFEKYEKAIETSSWVKTGEARCCKHGESAFVDCLLELEWISNSVAAGLDSGTLTILNTDGATTMMQFSLSDITCVVCCSEAGSPRIAVHAPRLPTGSSPVRLQFNGDTDMEDWMANLTSVCCQMNEVHGRPSENSMWVTTTLGDVFVFDPSNIESNQISSIDNKYCQDNDVSAAETPYELVLHNSFPPGSVLKITGCVYDDADRITFNLQCHEVVKIKHKAEKQIRDIPLHFNLRFTDDVVVRNTMQDCNWGDEERDGRMPFKTGAEFSCTIKCEDSGYLIYVDGSEFTHYHHRSPPETVSQLKVTGRVKLFQIQYKSNNVIVPMCDMFWRQMGGHMRRVETCNAGITWGVGYDHTAWVYTGGWGGFFLKGLESSNSGINSMSDTQNYFVYENQRWNPLTGFSATGLPTDRHMWSDVTGRLKRTREHTKLLSMHWQWVSDWIVDFHTPGGVDRDGWQYAVDFPAVYHGKKQFTDYVRRRRWYRKCRLVTSGPWQELGNTKILDVSLQVSNDSNIDVWAIAMNGDALYRKGVTKTSPGGSTWEHIPSDQPLASISCGPNGCVWAVGRNGSAYWRYGVSNSKPQGDSWNVVEPPSGSSIKTVSVGPNGCIWALDANGCLAVRKEVSKVFPEGSHWQVLPNHAQDPPHQDSSVSPGFRYISVGDQVWATASSGVICKRIGITQNNPAGTGWNVGIMGNWQHVCSRGMK